MLHTLDPHVLQVKYPSILNKKNRDHGSKIVLGKGQRDGRPKAQSSRVQLSLTLWSVARQALLSMGFSRQQYWSGLPFPSPGALPNPGIAPRFCALQTFFTIWASGKSTVIHTKDFPDAASGKEPTCTRCKRRDSGSIPGSGISLGRGHSNPLQYSCL